MTDLAASPLGHATTYSDTYDPKLLFAVERAPQRREIGIVATLPFQGQDVWTAYELSWLEASGKPQVGIATLRVPASSRCMVESKSMKLYLTAFNYTRFASATQVQATIARDLTEVTEAHVTVELIEARGAGGLPHAEPAGICLDDLRVSGGDDAPVAEALITEGGRVRETVFTHLFRSVCPVTGQPDYATVVVSYEGARMDHGGLLRYLLSFRRQPGFHEHCVETIFVDILRHCAPDSLDVHARFTRRGGIDINPYRSTGPMSPPSNTRTARQ
jgi:7-cyano-7-deazaguanine reductase